jgi:hypothetical protein
MHKILVFACHIKAYVNFIQIEIGFVFHFLPHEMATFAYLIGVAPFVAQPPARDWWLNIANNLKLNTKNSKLSIAPFSLVNPVPLWFRAISIILTSRRIAGEIS